MNEKLEIKLDEIKSKIIDLLEQKRALEKMLKEDALFEIITLMTKHAINLEDVREKLRSAEKNESLEKKEEVLTDLGGGWRGRGRPPKWLSKMSKEEREALKELSGIKK
jgi:hypothetical protein